MTRTQAVVFTAISVFILFVLAVAVFRVLEWLFAPQPWLWLVAVFLPFAAAGFVYVADALSEKPAPPPPETYQ